jgi:hypothetical protein
MSGVTSRKVLQLQTQSKKGESEKRWTEIPKEVIDGQTRKEMRDQMDERWREREMGGEKSLFNVQYRYIITMPNGFL